MLDLAPEGVVSGRRGPADFSAPTSARKQRELATSKACTDLSRHPDITGILVVTRWKDGSFIVSSRAAGPASDVDADGTLREMAIEAIKETTS